MQINLERPDQNSIMSYSNEQVVINKETFNSSLIVSINGIDSSWQKHHIGDVNENDVERILQFNPEVVLIGHQHPGQFVDYNIQMLLANKRVGLECMDIGAACRTFNVLLSELRNVTMALIIPDV